MQSISSSMTVQGMIDLFSGAVEWCFKLNNEYTLSDNDNVP